MTLHSWDDEVKRMGELFAKTLKSASRVEMIIILYVSIITMDHLHYCCCLLTSLCGCEIFVMNECMKGKKKIPTIINDRDIINSK